MWFFATYVKAAVESKRRLRSDGSNIRRDHIITYSAIVLSHRKDLTGSGRIKIDQKTLCAVSPDVDIDVCV